MHLSKPNITESYQKHYLSYNVGDAILFGSDTTAIVVGQMERFYVLDGNHMEQLKGKTLSECMSYFQENKKLKSKFSHDYDKKDMEKVVAEYDKFLNNNHH